MKAGCLTQAACHTANKRFEAVTLLENKILGYFTAGNVQLDSNNLQQLCELKIKAKTRCTGIKAVNDESLPMDGSSSTHWQAVLTPLHACTARIGLVSNAVGNDKHRSGYLDAHLSQSDRSFTR
jgi:hypothetical protein